jgi:hypothetical protein
MSVETLKAFVERMKVVMHPASSIGPTPEEFTRLFDLAARGAAIPDIPTETMIDDGCNAADDLMHCYQEELIKGQGFEGLEKAVRREISGAYCAMIDRAIQSSK